MVKTCARCLKQRPAAEMLLTLLGNYYCLDWGPCDREFHRRQRELAKKEGVAR